MTLHRPLVGKTVVVTRSREQAAGLTTALVDAGATVLGFPMIELCEPESYASLDETIAEIEDLDWLVFTSINGVRFFFNRLVARGGDARTLAGSRVAAVGSTTETALREHGIIADFVPDRFVGREILDGLGDDLTGMRIAIVRAEEGSDELLKGIRDRGGDARVAVAYRNRPVASGRDDLENALLSRTIDCVTFTSPTTVDNLFALLSDEARTIMATEILSCCIGPVTSDAARRHGISRLAEAREARMESLVETVIEHLSSR